MKILKRILREPTKALLWHTARLDNVETYWWNWLNHRVLGGPAPDRATVTLDEVWEAEAIADARARGNLEEGPSSWTVEFLKALRIGVSDNG